MKELKRLVDEDEVFALVAAFTMGADREISGFVDSEAIPLVGTFSLPTGNRSPESLCVPSAAGPRRPGLLVSEFARKNLLPKNPRVAILRDDEISADVLDALEAGEAGRLGSEQDTLPSDGAGSEKIVRGLSGDGTEMVLFFGLGSFPGADRRSRKSRLEALVYLPGSSVRQGIEDPRRLQKKIFLSTRASVDRTPSGMKDFLALLERHHLSREDLTARISLMRPRRSCSRAEAGGQELSRDKLVTALEKLIDFDTGLTPGSLDPTGVGP
jgi:hypothetical protein